MNIFHYSKHYGTIQDFSNIIRDFDSNIKLKTKKGAATHEDFIIDSKKADIIWEENKEDFLNNEYILFSDSTPCSWAVLKNLDKIKSNQKIILWIVMKFDYAIEDNIEYYNLLNKIKNDSRIYFLYSSPFYKIHLNCYVKDIPVQNEFLFFPYGKRLKSDYPCKNTTFYNNLYVMSYENETKFYPLIEELNKYNIKYDQKINRTPEEEYCGPFEIKNCPAIIHIPYAWSTMAFSEYISLGKTFILPSIEWLRKNYQKTNIWFQNSKNLDIIEKYSLWYMEEHKKCFIYFNDISEIPNLCTETNLKNKQKECKILANKILKNNLNILNTIIKK